MNFAKYMSVVLIATIKTLLSPPIAYTEGMSFWESFLCIALGGLLGFIFFFTLSDFGIKKANRYESISHKGRKIRRARKIINLKRKYKIGFFLFILPLFSIPVMAFVIRKFYGESRKIFFISLAIIVVWSLGSCLVFMPIYYISMY